MGCFTCIFHKKQKAKIHSHASKNGVVKDVYEQKNISPDIHKKNGINVSNGYVKQENTVEASPVKEFIKLDTYPKIISPVDESNARISGGVNSEMLFAGTIGSTIGSLSSSRLLATINDDKQAVDEDILKNYDFPFTNLVFEGGGNKGMAYVGALKVLEEAGITQKIIGVAGASVGAITAALFAVGFTANELKEFMETDLRKVLVDHKCGYCSLLPNLLSGFGWNPGNKMLKWFGEQLKEQTGNADITFRQVMQQFGRELCVVVTNLSQMSTEYFHPKTTPNTPIRTAVRMSTALPGVFQSVRYKLNEENTDVYVDGGLLCNYPIHAFDGWWLSMDPQDTFFKKLQPLDNYAKLFAKNERFGAWNHRTIGIMLYSHTETELMKTKLAQRIGNEPPPPPNSKLYRKRRKLRISQAEATQEHQAVVSAVGRFMKELHLLHFDLDGIVSLKELRKVFEVSKEFTAEDRSLLFGDADIEQAFGELDTDNDGEITFQELMSFVEKKGVNIQTRFLGYTRKEIRTLGDFIATLQTALAINVKRNYVEDRDIERTIGIDTDYIEANDFYLEELDKTFLLESGARSARSFLRHYCKQHPEHRRRGSAMLSKEFFDSPRLRKKFQTMNGKGETLNQLHPQDSVTSHADESSLDVDVPLHTDVPLHADIMTEADLYDVEAPESDERRSNFLLTPASTRADVHIQTSRASTPRYLLRRNSSQMSDISLGKFPFNG